MIFVQLHTFNSPNPTKKIGKGHIENGTTNIRLYELMGECNVSWTGENFPEKLINNSNSFDSINFFEAILDRIIT